MAIAIAILSGIVCAMFILYYRSQSQLENTTKQRDELWMLLDDIDTLDDICRDDDKRFRLSVGDVQRKRHSVVDSILVSDDVSRQSHHRNEHLISLGEVDR